MKQANVIKQLLSFLLLQRCYFIITCISAILSVIVHVGAPMVIGEAIDIITSTRTFSKTIPYLVTLLTLYLLYSVFTWTLMYSSNKIAFSSSCMLRKQLHEKLDHLPISFFDTNERGDIISRYINDIDNISDGFLQGLSTIISGAATIIISILFMLRISWQMSIVVMLSAPFTYFIARMITKRTHKYFRKQASTLGALNGYTEEMLAQIKTVKAYHFEHNARQHFKAINNELYSSGVTSQFFGSLANPSTRFVMNIAYSIVGVSGAMMSLLQLITIGNISTFLMYSNIFSKPFNEITGVMTQLQSALASAQRIFFILNQEEENETQPVTDIELHGEIDFDHVQFYYQANTPLMKDVNLHVCAGEKIAIVGRTGAGKTTFVNLLMRFYDIQHGSIRIDGINIRNLHRNSLRKNFGMVLQETYIFEGSIADNIAYGNEHSTRDDILQAAKKSGAHDFIRRLSKGYDTILHANSTTLSIGQRQLLSITRIILMNPAILILDEATSSIDTLSEQHVSNAMDTLMKGKTSFIIAHRLSTIIHADQILAMDHGDIIEQGTHEELLERNGYYASLYNSQFS